MSLVNGDSRYTNIFFKVKGGKSEDPYWEIDLIAGKVIPYNNNDPNVKDYSIINQNIFDWVKCIADHSYKDGTGGIGFASICNKFSVRSEDEDVFEKTFKSRFSGLIKKVNASNPITKFSRKSYIRFNTEDYDVTCVHRYEKNRLTISSIILPNPLLDMDKHMKTIFGNAYKDNSKIYVISGERGLGKTTLAKYFAKVCLSAETEHLKLKNSRKLSNLEPLNFKYVYFITSNNDNNTLRDIIEMGFICKDESVEDNTYEGAIEYLTNLEEDKLLIIDNFDNESVNSKGVMRFKDELASDSQVINDLINTGCYILITSKIDLSEATSIQGNQYKVAKYSVEELKAFFIEITGCGADSFDDAKLTNVIEKWLMQNTYAVKLAAKYVFYNGFNNFYRAISSQAWGGIEQHNIAGEEDTLLKLYCKLFALSILEDEDKVGLMYKLSIVPIDGIEQERFFSLAYSEKERKSYESAFHNLKTAYWVDYNPSTGIMSINPMVKAIFTQGIVAGYGDSYKFQKSYVSKFVSSICREMVKEGSTSKPAWLLKNAVSMLDALEQYAVKSYDMAFLYANVASIYDHIKGHKENNQKYAEKAIDMSFDLLSTVKDRSSMGVEDVFACAYALNRAGYAILHVPPKDTDTTSLAQKALFESQDLIKLLDKSIYENTILYTKNQGDIAAFFLCTKERKKAYDIHKSNAEFRKKMLETAKTNGDEGAIKEWKKLLANSYKGVGTCCYYLSKDDSDYMYEAKKNHKEALDLYQEICVEETEWDSNPHVLTNIDIIIAENRLIGTVTEMLNKSMYEADLDEIKQYVEMMIKAAVFFQNEDSYNKNEAANVDKNIAALEKIYEDKKMDNKELKDVIESAKREMEKCNDANKN